MLTRRQTIAAAAAAALSTSRLGTSADATPEMPAPVPDGRDDTVEAAPATVLPPVPDDEDYEIVVTIGYDLNTWKPDHDPASTGTMAPGTHRQTRGRYELTAGREGGAWRLLSERILVDNTIGGEHIYEPALIDVTQQTDGPDPLTLLAALLHGPPAHDTKPVIDDLSEDEHGALAAASADLRAELVRVMQEEDAFPRWFGRRVLTASPQELDGIHGPQRYMELMQRVRAEGLAAKVMESRAENMAIRADAYRVLAATYRASDGTEV